MMEKPTEKVRLEGCSRSSFRISLGTLIICWKLVLPLPLALAEIPNSAAESDSSSARNLAAVDESNDLPFPRSAFGEPPAPLDLGSHPYPFVPAKAAAKDRMPAGTGESKKEVSSESIESSGSGKTAGKIALKQWVDQHQAVQEVALIAGDYGYYPKVLYVTKDIPVRLYLTAASKKTLCMMMDDFQIRKQVRSQNVEEISFTPRQSGKFRFYCPVSGIEGTVLVKEPNWVLQTASATQGT